MNIKDINMVDNIEIFLNDKFIILKTLYAHQIDINGVMLCPITQQELADIIGCSKAKINSVLNELMEKEFVQMYNNTKGRYVLSDEAIKVIKRLS
jgi:predicted transcriptional regulator